eukprot:jgi/Bigna1/81987/fgenesh1_pg.86_\
MTAVVLTLIIGGWKAPSSMIIQSSRKNYSTSLITNYHPGPNTADRTLSSTSEQLRRPLDPSFVVGIEDAVLLLLDEKQQEPHSQRQEASTRNLIPPGATVAQVFEKLLSSKASETYPEYYYDKDDFFDDPFPRPKNITDLTDKEAYAFRSFVLWQLASKIVEDDASRLAFQKQVGRVVLKEQFPEIYAKAGGRQTSLRQSLEMLLRGLYDRGYLVSWQFQNVDLPLDEQEDEEEEEQASVVPAAASDDDLPLQARVIVERPADIEIVERLRASDGGFWGRVVPSLLSAVGERCGFTVDSDEFILMNQWEGPKTLQERVLKGLGDPFFQVPVPFKADSIVIDLQFRRRLQRS